MSTLGVCYSGGRWGSLWTLQEWKEVCGLQGQMEGGLWTHQGQVWELHAMDILWTPRGRLGALWTLGG